MTTITVKVDPKGRDLFHFNLRLVETFTQPNLDDVDPQFNIDPRVKSELKSVSDFIKSKISNFDLKTQHSALECLAGNLVAYYMIDFSNRNFENVIPLVMAVPLGNSDYPSNAVADYYGLNFFSKAAMRSLILACQRCGLLNVLKGRRKRKGYSSGFRTIVEPTQVLFTHLASIQYYSNFNELKPSCLVELQDNKGRLVKPTKQLLPKINDLASNVKAINESYRRYRFEVSTINYLPTYNGKQVYNYSSQIIPYVGSPAKSPLIIDISSDVSLRRIFKNSRLDSYGRFVCQLHNMRGIDRANIRIDGQPTVELDYKNTHSRILYHLKLRQDFKGDIYNVGLSSKYASASDIRRLVKVAFTIVFNCESSRSFSFAFKNQLAKSRLSMPRDLSTQKLVAAMKSTHPGLVKFFFSEMSLELMNYDSRIAEDVLLTFADKERPCLAVHDSFIVWEVDRRCLWDTMVKSHQKILNTSYVPEIK